MGGHSDGTLRYIHEMASTWTYKETLKSITKILYKQ